MQGDQRRGRGGVAGAVDGGGDAAGNAADGGWAQSASLLAARQSSV